MKTKKWALLITIISVFGFVASAQQTQPNPNPLIMPAYTPTAVTTPTSTPVAPYNNPTGGSGTPYTSPPMPQQIAPPVAPNPPPLTPPPSSLIAPTIVEPAHQPIPPPLINHHSN